MLTAASFSEHGAIPAASFESLEFLFDKAIANPSEITQDEKHQILEWPSREVMEENTSKHLHKTLDELFKMASNDPEALTWPECKLIEDDFRIMRWLDASGRQASKMDRELERPDLKSKWKQALAAVLSAEEAQALDNVNRVSYFKQTAYNQPGIEEDEKARKFGPPWVRKIISRGGEKTWGYVIYSSLEGRSSEDWEYLLRKFHYIVDEAPTTVGGDEIRESKVMEFVDFEGQQNEVYHLRGDFRKRRESGLKLGVLGNVVLFESGECRSSYKEGMHPWIWAIDPDWLSGADEDGYDGRVKVFWGRLYNKFYELMSGGKVTLKDIWKEYYRLKDTMTEDLSHAWLLTQLDQPQEWPDW